MKNEKGQSLFEVAIMFVAVLMILGGILDLGRLYFTHIAMEDAAGEAALYMSVNPDETTIAKDRAINASTGKIANLKDATVTISCFDYETNSPEACEETEVGDLIQVNVDYNYVFLAPFIPEINGSPAITLHSEAQSLVLVR